MRTFAQLVKIMVVFTNDASNENRFGVNIKSTLICSWKQHAINMSSTLDASQIKLIPVNSTKIGWL